jgi:alcohol dehydrogenase class IV
VTGDYRPSGDLLPTDEQLPSFGALRSPRHLAFGEGQRHGAARAVRSLGDSALVCTDKRMATSDDFLELVAEFKAAGLNTAVFSDVEAEVPVDSVLACADRFRADPPDVVVGVGGGSCLDHAKVTSLLLTHGGAPADYYGEFKVPGPTRAVMAIPTTAGTGSEVTPVAVVLDPGRDTKVGISSPYLIPAAAIVDPELTYSCPPTLTAHAAADALAHCIESFSATSRPPTSEAMAERVFVGKSFFTDAYALMGISLTARSLETVHRDPTSRSGRRDLMLAALLGGLALGTAGTAAAHAIQYPLGSATHTPHGMGVGALIPYVMEYNLPERIAEFGEIATALGLPLSGRHPDGRTTAAAAVDRVAELLGSVGIPLRLQEFGLQEAQLDWLAEQSMNAKRLVENNPRPLDVTAMRRIVEAAYRGDRATLRGS